MLYGVRDTVIATTNYLTLTIAQNRLVQDASSTEITRTLYEQLVSRVESLEGVVRANAVKGTITLTSTSWTSIGNSTYTQHVTIPGITEYSKIDLQPDTTVFSQLISDHVKAMWAVNNNSSIIIYALGASPSDNMTVQYTRIEVSNE